jgi:hypothetical protein
MEKEKKKRSHIFLTLILCIIGIILGWFAGSYFYNNTNKDNKLNNTSNDNKEEKVQKEKLSLDDETINFLSTLTLNTYYFEMITEEDVVIETLFSDTKVNVASLSTNFKMTMALSTLKVSEKTTTIPKEDMLQAYKKVFGTTDIAESFESMLAGNHGKLTLDGENYKWEHVDWGTDGYSSKVLAYEAYKYDDRIEIDYIFAYNNMGDLLGNPNFTTVEYYGKDNKTVVFSYKFGNMDYDDDGEILKHADSFKHYIGTYTKANDGNYYITSVEPKN